MTTAKQIRVKCDKDIKKLQESCPHKRTEWMENEVRLGCYIGEVRVCLRCEKVLERQSGCECRGLEYNE